MLSSARHPNGGHAMTYYLLKVLTAALVIVGITETAKLSTRVGALIAALPAVSLVSFVWLYLETRDTERIAALSLDTFWLVLPTLPMFIVLPMLLRRGLGFGPALLAACALTAALAALTVLALRRWGMGG